MIIVGDIAAPTQALSYQLKEIFREHKAIFRDNGLICNLEGLISDKTNISSNEPLLFNHSSVLDALKEGNIRAIGLANNHTLDLPAHFRETKKKLIESNISFTGASESSSYIGVPAEFYEKGKKVLLFNFCWDFLLYNHKNPSQGVHVFVIEEEKIIELVAKYRQQDDEAIIVVFLHWNFDLEILPFPMHRQFSRSLIDHGANYIIGSHSHCVQGGERYRDGFILYGVGNFFIPYNIFAGGYLTFPDFARVQLAFEFDLNTNVGICHWFEYQNNQDIHFLKHLASEDFEDSRLLEYFSPYSGMNDSEYYQFFKRNRRKKALIPIFRDYEKKRMNNTLTFFLKLRASLARKLAKYKIISWQR